MGGYLFNVMDMEFLGTTGRCLTSQITYSSFIGFSNMDNFLLFVKLTFVSVCRLHGGDFDPTLHKQMDSLPHHWLLNRLLVQEIDIKRSEAWTIRIMQIETILSLRFLILRREIQGVA